MANNFLTVEEARHITAEARALQGEYKKAQTKAILDTIREGAKKGMTSVTVYTKDCTDQVIVDRLTNLGYNVSVFSDQRDGSSLTISWD
jgi:hypothetical protein